LAEALLNMDQYLSEFRTSYLNKKKLLVNGLKDLGYKVIDPQGTYFVMVEISDNSLDDIAFCKKLISEKKVATIPTSAFYLKSGEGKKLIRFCFAKKDETLKAALINLK
jgi:aspartate/methionine/tyrosine aminotransferase